jgi:hypothetical protein
MPCSYVMDHLVLGIFFTFCQSLIFPFTGNRIERCLCYDEKPLFRFQKLKDAKKNPVFMLKHIKDILSPIVVAQRKHALRKLEASISSERSTSSVTPSHADNPIAVGQGKSIARPPKLEVSDLSTPTPLTGTTPQAGWDDVLSPVVENESSEECASSRPSSSATLVNSVQSSECYRSGTTLYASSEAESTKREIPPSMGVSYAVAIYPYMAEQEDEFDVVVCVVLLLENLVLVSPRCIVGTPLSLCLEFVAGGLRNGTQRDPTGSGIVDSDTPKQGWVPAGCLLETNVPVASAIAEAIAAAKAADSSDVSENKTPILPLSIISTSLPGIALMEYKKKGDEELDLVRDDALTTFKRYNHWLYVRFRCFGRV